MQYPWCTGSIRGFLACSLVFLGLLCPVNAHASNRVSTVSFESVDKLVEYYENEDYTLEEIQGGRYIILEELPDNFDSIRDVALRKNLFQRVVLPLIYYENERIASERSVLKKLQSSVQTATDTGIRLTDDQRQKLLYLRERYDLEETSSRTETLEGIQEMVRRVDTIPPSLVLAQATNESGWGTSRFAIKGNNLFGVRSYNENTPGFKPRGVPDTSGFRVRKFPTLLDSVRNYMTTLNTHHAYEDFRVLRARYSHEDPLKLVQGLTQYSERREEYLDRLVSLIKGNNYRRFDN